jgi:16S rRNA A1518/A1519 N6-dimethyltransferase RsmA/KsgA/DIM1 with predicted DNA glycosylase/AP lyase activity
VYKSSPSGNHFLEEALKDLNIVTTDAILDIGCGKGSAMRTMLKFPFARVDGLEISRHIAEIAIRNFEKLNTSRCQVCIGDAADFQGYELYNIFYIYNPFSADVLSKVMGRILRSLKKVDREIIILYANPQWHAQVVSKGVFFRLMAYPGESGYQIYVYSNRVLRQSRLINL